MRDMFLNMNQANMIEIQNNNLDGKGKSKLNLEDFVLLRRIGDFILSSKTISIIQDNKIYHWVNYGTIQNSLPVVFPSTVSLKKRIEKLKKLGLIINKKYNVKKSDISEDGFKNAGTYSVIQLSKEVRQLFDEPIKIEACEGSHHNGVKGSHHNGVNKEPQEKNSKKENPSLGICVSLSKEQEKELQHDLNKELQETRKLNPVSKAVSKAGGSALVVGSILVPLARQYGKQAVINILKDIKTEGNNNPIRNFEALIKSRI
ncbi:MAG: hypothetical protein WBG30_08845 [Psychrilyobacter sp.]|uniref:hypothetical protein n=1 Tax=Psychrilyobacter sp. TaxID=2586924 RepID=UPI003C773F8A